MFVFNVERIDTDSACSCPCVSLYSLRILFYLSYLNDHIVQYQCSRATKLAFTFGIFRLLYSMPKYLANQRWRSHKIKWIEFFFFIA